MKFGSFLGFLRQLVALLSGNVSFPRTRTLARFQELGATTLRGKATAIAIEIKAVVADVIDANVATVVPVRIMEENTSVLTQLLDVTHVGIVTLLKLSAILRFDDGEAGAKAGFVLVLHAPIIQPLATRCNPL